jgi:hypothetical protein
MMCVKCRNNNTKCIDDMLQVGYVAEIYKCNDCSGTIEVEYQNERISSETIKNYKYTAEV